jgi:hypothetical protein
MQDYNQTRAKYQEDQESATDKLFNNKGGVATGLQGRRKFVPPTKSSNDCGGGGSFQPGQSV